METQIGDTIPSELKQRYSKFRKLGAGAVGQVFTAHDANLDKYVAIKLLKNKEMTPDRAIRFQQEARAASKLKHQNIVTLMDFGIAESGEPYLIMESVDGRSLDNVLNELGTLSLSQSANIIRQVCAGMQHAHANGVIHRDLKPSNIIVSGEDLETWSVKVVDFGVAKLDGADTAGGITRTGMVVGTPHYMSPEQISGNSVDGRSDIYAIGSMLFHMLSGSHPFEGETILEVMQKKNAEKAPRLSKIYSGIPSEFDQLVATALETNPEKRYQSLKEFSTDLNHAFDEYKRIEEEKEVAERAVRTEIKPKPINFRPLVYGVSAVVVITIVATCFAMMYFKNDKKELVELVSSQPVLKKSGAEAPPKKSPPSEMFEPYVFGAETWTAKDNVTDDDLEWLAYYKKDVCRGLIIAGSEKTGAVQELITKRGWAAVGRMHLKFLNLSYSSADDEAISCVAGMPELQSLQVEKSRIGDGALKCLEGSQIADLGLAGTNITSDGLKSLGKMPALAKVHLEGTQIDDRGLADLAKSKSLRSISLDHCNITDNGLRYLAPLAELEGLSLQQTNITEKGLRSLKGLKHLDYLSVDSCPNFNDDCLALIAHQWPQLETLDLPNTNVTVKGMNELVKFKKLTKLTASALTLDDDGFAPVFDVKSLEILNLSLNSITDKTVSKVATLPRLNTIILNNCANITPVAVHKLKKIRNLKVNAYDKMNLKETEDFAQVLLQ